MYKKATSIALKESCSPFGNNLTVVRDAKHSVVHYAMATRNILTVSSCPLDNSAAGKTVNRPFVFRDQSATKVCHVVQMLDAETLNMIFYYPIHDAVTDTFARGICSVGNDVFVGTHDGHILAFNVPTTGRNIYLRDTLKAHRDAVWDLVSFRSDFVSSDNEGSIILWTVKPESKETDVLEKSIAISGMGYPCTSVALWADLIIGAFGSGHIRIFARLKGSLLAEITAHARWINAICVAPTSGMLVSCGDDAFVRVWRLSTDVSATVSHVSSIQVGEYPLYGVQFIDPDGKAFGCTAYESNEIMVYQSA